MSAEGLISGSGAFVRVGRGRVDGDWAAVVVVVVNGLGDDVVVLAAGSAAVHPLMISTIAPRMVMVLDRMVIPSHGHPAIWPAQR